jgi:hypothetical protein
MFEIGNFKGKYLLLTESHESDSNGSKSALDEELAGKAKAAAR